MAGYQKDLEEAQAQEEYASNARDVFEQARSKNIDAVTESLDSVSSDFAWFMSFVNTLSQTTSDINKA